MLEQFNYDCIRCSDVCKSSAGKFLGLGKNLGTALTNGLDNLVHIVNV